LDTLGVLILLYFQVQGIVIDQPWYSWPQIHDAYLWLRQSLIYLSVWHIIITVFFILYVFYFPQWTKTRKLTWAFLMVFASPLMAPLFWLYYLNPFFRQHKNIYYKESA